MTPMGEFDERLLTGLSTLSSDPIRSARTRQRCRAALQRRVRAAHRAAPEAHAPNGRRPLTPRELAYRQSLAGAVGILCVVYVVALIAITVSLQGTIP